MDDIVKKELMELFQDFSETERIAERIMEHHDTIIFALCELSEEVTLEDLDDE